MARTRSTANRLTDSATGTWRTRAWKRRICSGFVQRLDRAEYHTPGSLYRSTTANSSSSSEISRMTLKRNRSSCASEADTCPPIRWGSGLPGRKTEARWGCRLPRTRDRELLHRLQQRRLGLGRRAVDFVEPRRTLARNGPGNEGPGAVTGGDIFLDHIGTGNVRGHEDPG